MLQRARGRGTEAEARPEDEERSDCGEVVEEERERGAVGCYRVDLEELLEHEVRVRGRGRGRSRGRQKEPTLS